MTTGENIKKLRDYYGMNQKQFGAIAGVSDKAVSSWEKGKKEPRGGAIEKIVAHFGMKKRYIIEEGGFYDFLRDKEGLSIRREPEKEGIGKCASAEINNGSENIKVEICGILDSFTKEQKMFILSLMKTMDANREKNQNEGVR